MTRLLGLCRDTEGLIYGEADGVDAVTSGVSLSSVTDWNSGSSTCSCSVSMGWRFRLNHPTKRGDDPSFPQFGKPSVSSPGKSAGLIHTMSDVDMLMHFSL